MSVGGACGGRAGLGSAVVWVGPGVAWMGAGVTAVEAGGWSRGHLPCVAEIWHVRSAVTEVEAIGHEGIRGLN